MIYGMGVGFFGAGVVLRSLAHDWKVVLYLVVAFAICLYGMIKK